MVIDSEQTKREPRYFRMVDTVSMNLGLVHEQGPHFQGHRETSKYSPIKMKLLVKYFQINVGDDQ